MHLPPPTTRPSPLPEAPAEVRTNSREDMMWSRPIFRAPPLRVNPPAVDVTVLYYEGVPPGRGNR